MIVISCYLGKNRTAINMAPLNSKCYFFSNNNKIKKKAEASGWQFIHINHMPIESDLRISSLQSKYIKFLQFDKNLINWVEGESIVYFDHKLNVKQSDIQKAVMLCKNEILIQNHPTKNLINDEIKDSMKQPRYAETMDETINWIKSKVDSGNYDINNMIMATGFILFTNVMVTQKLCDDVYRKCIQLGQPECQIIWGILSQKYENNLTRIDWDVLDIKKAPYSLIIRISAFFKRTIKKILGKL